MWLFVLLVFVTSLSQMLLWRSAAAGDASPPFPDDSAARALVQFTAFTGLLAGGLYAFMTPHNRIFPGLVGLWWLLGLGWVMAVILNPAALVLSALYGAEVLLLLALIASASRLLTRQITPSLVWLVALVLHALLRLLNALGVEDPWLLTLHAHLLLMMANALAFWLMYRYSNITRAWGELGFKVTCGWLLTAAVVLVPDLRSLPGWLQWLAAFYVLLAYVVFAAHAYRALSDRSETQTLAAHWHGLMVLLLLVVVGGLGAVLRLPGIARAVGDFWLAAVPTEMATVAPLLLGLGLVNQAVAEMRADGRRVTGLLPFWMICGGLLLAFLAISSAGLLQLVLARIGYLESPADLLTLYRFAAVGWALFSAGVLIYMLGLYARRL